jgi:pimeloyl-ACP methyl ester carboxylesterase
MEITSKFVYVGNIKIHFLEAWAGDQVVVLLHGGGLDNASLSWELLIPELSKDKRVIAPDLPGYRKSNKPDVVYDLA